MVRWQRDNSTFALCGYPRITDASTRYTVGLTIRQRVQSAYNFRDHCAPVAPNRPGSRCTKRRRQNTSFGQLSWGRDRVHSARRVEVSRMPFRALAQWLERREGAAFQRWLASLTTSELEQFFDEVFGRLSAMGILPPGSRAGLCDEEVRPNIDRVLRCLHSNREERDATNYVIRRIWRDLARRSEFGQPAH